jgi:hypothetical protein
VDEKLLPTFAFMQALADRAKIEHWQFYFTFVRAEKTLFSKRTFFNFFHFILLLIINQLL